MIKILLLFCIISVFSRAGVTAEPRLFLGLATDAAFFGEESTLTDSTSINGIEEIGNIIISEKASSRELGIRFLTGYQFIHMIDVYIGLGGYSLLTSQTIGSEKIAYVQKNAFSFEFNTKGTIYVHKSIGIYTQVGTGLSYIYLTSAGGSGDIDLGLRWHDIGGHILIGVGNSFLTGETNNHRFSLGLHSKFIFQNNKPYSIKTNNTVKTLTFGVTNFLLGAHLEYIYLL